MTTDWDAIVVGGGHAGCEAAHALAKMGCRTLLMTLDPARIGFMSCNPAIGGLGKGHLVKEVDALGGVMARITDLAGIQYRKLNSSKGPAVRATRVQCDKAVYAKEMTEFLSRVPGLTLRGGEIAALRLNQGRVSGLVTADGVELRARAVVITSGTFLRGKLFTGDQAMEGGRVGDRASQELSASLMSLGFQLSRLKTGTPPRLHRRSIDWSRLEEQPGDPMPEPVSQYRTPARFPWLAQISCYITHTNLKTHDVILANLHRSPMYSGRIEGIGPRYCPSIEDKVKRFADKERHQLFLEPEGLSTDEVYVNGISTSLPAEVQEQFVHSIAGLEEAEFLRFGYAVEYDAIDARALYSTFASKDVGGLYFAGQVNGTSGYEEAAAQGLIAGINAALEIQERPAWVPARDLAYLGVLADDLVTRGADEPYRMFTSRAEHRLLLREDNADLRLASKGRELGLLGEEEWAGVERRAKRLREGLAALDQWRLKPADLAGRTLFSARGLPELKDSLSGTQLLRRPEIRALDLPSLGFAGEGDWDARVWEVLEIEVKYAGYIERERHLLEGVRRSDGMRIPVDLAYTEIPGLSNEVKSRLLEARPSTLGQMSRLPGMTPAAVANLLVYLKVQEREVRA